MVTLILLVHNNTQHFKRCLDYYYSIDCRFALVVADSSVKDLSSQHVFLVDFYKNVGLDVTYYYFEHYSYVQKVSAVLDFIITPYVALTGVDDFRSLKSLQEAVNFLENNKDYVVVYGCEYGFTYDLRDLKWFNTGRYLSLQTIHSDAWFDRVNIFLNHYATTLYGVFSTILLRNFFEQCVSYAPDVRFAENFLTLQCLLKGKMYFLKAPFLWREMSSTSEGALSVKYIFDDLTLQRDRELMLQGTLCALQKYTEESGDMYIPIAYSINRKLFDLFLKRVSFEKQKNIRNSIVERLPLWSRNIKRCIVAAFIRYKERRAMKSLLKKNFLYVFEFNIIEQAIKKSAIPAFRGDMADLGQYERL